MTAEALRRKLFELPRVSTQAIKAADLSRAGMWVQWSGVLAALAAVRKAEDVKNASSTSK